MHMALRLQAHRGELRRGVLPDAWLGDPPAWTCAQIVRVSRLPKSPKLAEVAFAGMTGVLAGDVLAYRLGAGYCMQLLRECGAPRFAEVELRDLLGCCLLAKFGKNKHSRQYLLETHIPETMRKANRDLYKERHPDYGNRNSQEGW
jgi:hypothetical protein